MGVGDSIRDTTGLPILGCCGGSAQPSPSASGLSLNGCNIGASGGRALAEALASAPELMIVELMNNRMGEAQCSSAIVPSRLIFCQLLSFFFVFRGCASEMDANVCNSSHGWALTCESPQLVAAKSRVVRQFGACAQPCAGIHAIKPVHLRNSVLINWWSLYVTGPPVTGGWKSPAGKLAEERTAQRSSAILEDLKTLH